MVYDANISNLQASSKLFRTFFYNLPQFVSYFRCCRLWLAGVRARRSRSEHPCEAVMRSRRSVAKPRAHQGRSMGAAVKRSRRSVAKPRAHQGRSMGAAVMRSRRSVAKPRAHQGRSREAERSEAEGAAWSASWNAAWNAAWAAARIPSHTHTHEKNILLLLLLLFIRCAVGCVVVALPIPALISPPSGGHTIARSPPLGGTQ